VSSEISDFTPYAHAQSNILHMKYAEKTDDSGLGFGVEANVSGYGLCYSQKKKNN